jgi:hypothetical protein
MTQWARCPGCGHNYGWGFGRNSDPNEHGFCGWCRQEGWYCQEDVDKWLEKQKQAQETLYEDTERAWREQEGW